MLPGNPNLVKSVTPYEMRKRFMGDLEAGIDLGEMMKKSIASNRLPYKNFAASLVG